MLIEIIIAISLLLISITMVFNLSERLITSREHKINEFRMKESMSAICKEIQLNIKFEELSTLLEKGEIRLKYDKDFMDHIVNKDLLKFEKTEDTDNFISINLISKESQKLKLKIKIQSKGSILDSNINKELWMDYV